MMNMKMFHIRGFVNIIGMYVPGSGLFEIANRIHIQGF